MTLLDQLISQGLVDVSLLAQLGESVNSLSDLEKLRRLIRQELLDEYKLLPVLAQRYQISMLSEFSMSLQEIEDIAFSRMVYEKKHVLLVRRQGQSIGLLSIFSDFFSLDQIAFHLQGVPQWYLTTHQQLHVYLQLFQHPEWMHEESSTDDFIQRILEEAISRKSSDIHLEPEDAKFLVRLRVDGKLEDALRFPIETQTTILSRIKILGGMDIAVKRRPQDGRYSYRSQKGSVYDLRISSLPTQSGEKVVIRLLDQAPVQYQLEALGFFKDDLEILSHTCLMSSGLILVVGPTGSGKTTTLYAMLNQINTRDKNIITIEDPVEYHIKGLNQVSVQASADLTFAHALRAALRQDPDVILVGEIRDEETAEIAIKAALTGHLVFATLHSIDAVTTIQRLSNLNVDLDLLAETLKLVVSQRLVRRMCSHASASEQCQKCHGSGYSGRVPIYEILKIDPSVKERIRKGNTGKDLIAPSETLYFHSFDQTAKRLTEQGVTDSKELESLITEH
ncbi:GspE/PulE family protein [Deltaproteobacteria bacterium TL4]